MRFKKFSPMRSYFRRFRRYNATLRGANKRLWRKYTKKNYSFFR